MTDRRVDWRRPLRHGFGYVLAAGSVVFATVAVTLLYAGQYDVVYAVLASVLGGFAWDRFHNREPRK